MGHPETAEPRDRHGLTKSLRPCRPGICPLVSGSEVSDHKERPEWWAVPWEFRQRMDTAAQGRWKSPICPGVRFLGHMVAVVLYGTSILFSIMVAPTLVPTSSVGGFPFLHTLSPFIICNIFDDGCSDQCELIPYCSFDLHFCNNWSC